ncbi:MAG: hypothetical protein PQJ61_05480 [Spirochaetales bacterium]|uniref:DUF5666 domain-containing protein n=1 Tax=Candidatus Thalassospirochaeta sargassi TaxID=3119039 RepID=A0AAJ1IBF3_9SPIO|nr:hypothetical protein [Spirochaetales bacterium]
MKTVIKKIFVVLIMLTAFSAWADDGIQPVDLSITIRSLADSALTGSSPEAGTAVILNGTVIERTVTNPDKDAYSAELMMASGEWITDAEVTVSKCIILLNGPEYSEMVPARRSRTVNPKEIILNSELLVYGVFLGWAETSEGVIAVVEAGGVRKL